jgi:hypothetical protein
MTGSSAVGKLTRGLAVITAEQRLRAGQKFSTNLSSFFGPVKLQLQCLREITENLRLRSPENSPKHCQTGLKCRNQLLI